MINIFDVIILYLMASSVLGIYSDVKNLIMYLLIGVIYTMTTILMGDSTKKSVKLIVCSCATLAFVAFPAMLPYICISAYVFAYESSDRMQKIIRIILLELILFIDIYINVGYEDSKIGSGLFVAFSSAGIILATYFATKTKRLFELEKKIKIVRDDSTERNIYLSRKNNELLQTKEQEIHIATLSERNRIAREIHDNVGHILSRSILQLGAIMAIHKNEPVANELEGLKVTMNQAMDNIRESVHDLHKESFDIKEAAEKILDEYNQYEIKFDCDISKDADKDIKYAFLTILKEALTNIGKHSDATTINIIYRELEDYYQMVVADNGSKPVNISHINAGIGLSNIEDRIRSVNGIVNFTYNKGFRIFISVPKSSTK